MRGFLFLLILIGLFTFQSTAYHFFYPWSSALPDCALLMALHYGIRRGKIEGGKAGMVIGFIQDLLSFGATGAFTFTKGVIGFGVGSLRERYFNDSGLTRISVVVGATLFDSFTYGLLLNSLLGVNLSTQLVGALPSLLVLNLLFSLLLFPFLDSVERFLERWNAGSPDRYRTNPYQ